MKRKKVIISGLLIFAAALIVTACLPSDKEKQVSSQVLVASHRGDWRSYADNSIEGIESCIRMGVDIVEIDVCKTKDGHLILMHDKSLDRTTNGKGMVSDFTLEEINQYHLRNGLGRVTRFRIPTFEEAMLVAKGKIKVNVDKGDKCFGDVYEVLKKTNTLDDAIIKSDKSYAQLREQFGVCMDEMTFMQIIALKDTTTFEDIAPLLEKKYPYYEICCSAVDDVLWKHIRQTAERNHSVIWLNSLWDSLCGGHSDDRALTNPDATWGYLIDSLGAGVLQTDRPEMMLNYLRKRKLHQ